MDRKTLLVAPGLVEVFADIAGRDGLSRRFRRRIGKPGVDAGEIDRRPVELRIAGVDPIACRFHLAGADDGVLADKRIGTVAELLQQGEAAFVARLQASRRILAGAGTVAISDPALLVFHQMVFCRPAQPGRERSIDCRHIAIGLRQLGVLADRTLDRGRSLSALEARAALCLCLCRLNDEKQQRRRGKPSHVGRQVLRRRTASSISPVDPAKDMRSVPVPLARSKSMPGVVATPVSRSIRLQNSRLSLVRWETSA